MIPYPGESLGIFYAVANGTDDTLGGDVVWRGAETATNTGYRTLASGEEWRAWVSPGSMDYLDDPADCDGTPAWVVVVDSGTVTVIASEGLDPSYGDATAAHPTSLGSHTLTVGANVIPSGFTVADVAGAADSLMFVVEATAGSAVVSQVKLRLWPAAGALGGWSGVKPSFTTTPSAPDVRTSTQQFFGSAEASTRADAWDGGAAAYLADVAANSGAVSRQFVNPAASGPRAQRTLSLGSITPTYIGSFSSTANQRMLTGQRPDGLLPIDGDYVQGVDWIRPPDEVSGDVTAYVQADGDPATEWLNATGIASTSGDAVPGDTTVTSQAGDWTRDSGTTSAPYYTFPISHAPAVVGPVSLATDGPMILVTVSHSMAADGPGAYDGAVSMDQLELGGLDLSGVQSCVRFQSYRYWDPNGAVAVPLRLMQRGDGLGMGSGRVYATGTRQASTRVFGSL